MEIAKIKKREEGRLRSRPRVPALDQTIRILFYLQKNAGEKMSLKMIHQALDIPKSKCHSLLTILQEYDLVEKDPNTKTYTLGAKLIPLARAVLDHLDYRTAAAPFVEELAKETGGAAWFALKRRESLMVATKYEGGEHFWVTPGIGHTFVIPEGPHGRSVLANLPDEERENIVGRCKGADIVSLREELASIRQLGFARDLGQFAKGINAVAATVFGPGKQIVGVLLLFGTFPPENIDRYGQKTADAARCLSQKLGN